jgi:hypothetical protein
MRPLLRRFAPLFKSIHAAIAAELALTASGMTTPFPNAIFVADNNCAGLAVRFERRRRVRFQG